MINYILKNQYMLFFFVLVLVLIEGNAFSASSPKKKVAASGFKYSAVQLELMSKVKLKRWDTDKGIEKLIKLPVAKGNAAFIYSKLGTIYKKEVKRKRFLLSGEGSGMAQIVKAAKIRKCSLVPAFYKPMVTFEPDTINVVVFRVYADALERQALEYEKAGQLDKAEIFFESLIIMGWHLTEDRPNLLVYFLGLAIEEKACRNYAKYLSRQIDDRARKMRAYGKYLNDNMLRVRIKARMLLSSWIEFASLAACQAVALRDKESLWRQDAVINLGVMQNGYPDETGKFQKNPLEQKIARNILKNVAAKDALANIRKLANWCLKNMTEEKFRKKVKGRKK